MLVAKFLVLPVVTAQAESFGYAGGLSCAGYGSRKCTLGIFV